MKHAALITLAVSLALSSVGCKSLLRKRVPTEDSASTAAAPPPIVAAPPPLPAAPPPAPLDDLPTPEDFEDAAFEKITAQNFQVELTRLKKEIETP